jgi:hypothetical protein
VICEIVTFELPELVIVTVCGVEDVPVVTLPKFRLVGLIPRTYVAAMPEPLRLIAVGEVGALLTIERMPEAAPTDVGTNATVIVPCCPAFMFNGSENPLTVNAAPDSFTWLMLNVAVPVLVRIKPCDVLVPTTSLPKLMEFELT